MPVIERVSRAVYALVSLVLMAFALGVIVYAAASMIDGMVDGSIDARNAILTGVGYTIIAVAIFDVAKYLLEEEVLRAREMRHAGEARRSLTKFLSTITIVVFLEAIVAIFTATHEPVARAYAAVTLLLGGVALVVGFGIYLRLSASAEKTLGGAKGEAQDEAQGEAAQEAARGGAAAD